MLSVRTTLLPSIAGILSLLSTTHAAAQSVVTPQTSQAADVAPAPQLAQAPRTAAAAVLPTEVRWGVVVAARPSAPPAIGGDGIFVALQSGAVVAHRLADGSEAWRVDLRAEQPLAVDAGRVFVASGEAIHALDAAAGAVRWRAPSGALSAPILAQDGWVIAASAGSLVALRSEDGSKVWGREVGAVATRSAIHGDALYVPLADGRVLALDLQTGATRWERRLVAAPKSPAPAGAISEVLADADRVYAGAADGRFYCLDAADGSLAWRFRVGAALRGRPVSDGRRIYIASIDNVVRAFDKDSGALLWHPSLPFRPAGPVLLGGTLMVPGTASEVRAFDATGKPAGIIKLEASLAIPPAFAESTGGRVMAAVTGSLSGQWTLLLMEESRGVAVEPLTSLPGLSVPVELPGSGS